jgi:hypothetical protein
MSISILDGSAAPPASLRLSVRRSRFGVMFVPILSAEDGLRIHSYAHNSRSPPPLPTAPHRRPGKLGRGQASRRRVSAGVFETFTLRGCAREGFFSDARNPFSTLTPTGNACGGEPSGRSSGRFTPAGSRVADVVAQRRRKYERAHLALTVVVDTRVDPLMPHNAIFIRSAVERLSFRRPALR